MPTSPGPGGGIFSAEGHARQFPPGSLRFVAPPLEPHVKHINGVLKNLSTVEAVKDAQNN